MAVFRIRWKINYVRHLDADFEKENTSRVMKKSVFGNEDGTQIHRTYEPSHEKTSLWVSDEVRHKSGCTATEND